MTVTPIHRPRTPCAACGLPTANAGTHGRVCTGPVAPEHRHLVLRAGAAAATPALLAADARFRGVSDLDVARLLYALDSGTLIVLGGNLEWAFSGRLSPFHGRLTRVVREAIRTGLAHATPQGTLAADPVHARSSRHPATPACGAPGQLRYRLLGGEHLGLVDCEACLDAPLSGVAYSTDE
jgi:hypothetical protein